MELIIEFIFDLILDGSQKVAEEKKISPWIRIPCLLLILIVGVAVIGCLGFIGIFMNR